MPDETKPTKFRVVREPQKRLEERKVADIDRAALKSNRDAIKKLIERERGQE